MTTIEDLTRETEATLEASLNVVRRSLRETEEKTAHLEQFVRFQTGNINDDDRALLEATNQIKAYARFIRRIGRTLSRSL